MEEFNLDKLKHEYKLLQEKYNLTSFEKLNEDFEIEKIAESETDFVLREVRKMIVGRLFDYLKLIESILNPSNASMLVFAIAKAVGVKERETLADLYKKIGRIQTEIVKLELEYSEEKEAESIKKYVELWNNELRKPLNEIMDSIQKNLDNKTEDNGKGYFG